MLFGLLSHWYALGLLYVLGTLDDGWRIFICVDLEPWVHLGLVQHCILHIEYMIKHFMGSFE